MVVSPQPRRPAPATVPSIEVLSPWASTGPGTVWAPVTGVWSPASDNCDQTPLLNVSSPSSDAAGQCQNSFWVTRVINLDKMVMKFSFRWRVSRVQHHRGHRHHRGGQRDLHQHWARYLLLQSGTWQPGHIAQKQSCVLYKSFSGDGSQRKCFLH